MTKVLKFLCLVAAALTLHSVPAMASSGIFGTGVVISTKVSGSNALDLFEITLLGDARHSPAAGGGNTLGTPTLINTTNGSGTSTWASGSGPSLGTFNVSNGDLLTLDGGEMLTFKNGASNVSGTDLFYSIDGGTFIDVPLVFNQDNVNATTGDQRWYSDGANVALQNLSNGTHTLAVFFRDSNTDDTNDFINNGAANYKATFTVVPEPSSVALLLTSSVFGSFFLLRRRRRVSFSS